MPVKTEDLTTQGPDGPVAWKLTTLGATAGLKALTHLIGMIGGGLGALAGAASGGDKKDALDIELDGDMMTRALGAISAKIAEPSTVDFIKSLLKGLVKDNKPLGDFDLEFAGNYRLLLLELLPWALKVNFGDFFEGAVGVPALLGKLTALAPTSARSSGGSGGS